MDYVTWKWLHVLSSTRLFGTGLGSAFYMYFASRTRDMAQAAAARNEELPPGYWAYLRVWTILGMPAFAALILVFWLMIAKPA